MNKVLITLAALVAAAEVVLAGSTGNGFGAGNTPPSTDGGVKGLGAHTDKYTASYTDPFFGPVTCTGVHQAGKNFGVFGQDSFTCTAQPVGAALQNVAPNQTLTLATFGGWYSDYGALKGQFVLAIAFNGIVSADGTSYTAVANYP